jgi:hypothetical protein
MGSVPSVIQMWPTEPEIFGSGSICHFDNVDKA